MRCVSKRSVLGARTARACARLISGSEGGPFSKFTPSGLSFSPALDYPEADFLQVSRAPNPGSAAALFTFCGAAKVQVVGEAEGLPGGWGSRSALAKARASEVGSRRVTAVGHAVAQGTRARREGQGSGKP